MFHKACFWRPFWWENRHVSSGKFVLEFFLQNSQFYFKNGPPPLLPHSLLKPRRGGYHPLSWDFWRMGGISPPSYRQIREGGDITPLIEIYEKWGGFHPRGGYHPHEPNMASVNGCTVHFQMCPQSACKRGCIFTLVALIWLHYTFSNVSSNCLSEKRRSHIGCICLIFLHCPYHIGIMYLD